MNSDIYSDINSAFEKAGWSPAKRLEHFDNACLTEDIAQFEKDNIIIDFGFYGDLNEPNQGEYIVYVVREHDWEKPIVRIFCKDKRAALACSPSAPMRPNI